MINIASMQVKSFSLEFLDVFWELADTDEDISQYTFQVQRAESPEGPFENISAALTEIFSFRDTKVNLLSFWRIWYYRIKIFHTSNSQTNYSPVGYLGFKPDLVALEMSRLHQTLLQSNIGLPVIVMKRRTTGPSCPFCYDPIRKRSTDSDCLTCLGTNQYRGGFMDPIGTFVNLSPANKAMKIANITETEPDDKSMDMSGYPLMSPGDLIIDQENRRYRVVQVRNRSKRGFVHRQLLQTSQLPRENAVYKLKIDPTLFPDIEGELWPQPAQYGRVQWSTMRSDGPLEQDDND